MTDICNDSQLVPGKKVIKRSKFTSEEDGEIRSLVAQFGSNAWDAIAAAMAGNRSKRQLRERWLNYLNPDHDAFYTEAEDHALVALYMKVGAQWAKIAGAIGTKSAISVRNRYRSLQSMRARGVRPDYQRYEGLCTTTQEVVPEQDLTEFNFQFGNIGITDSWDWDIDSCL
jgi:hypothetical protein